jgi:hypothetical protein
MLLMADLPVRIFDDLRIEADPGAQLTPAQGLALGEELIRRAVRKQVADKVALPPAKLANRNRRNA